MRGGGGPSTPQGEALVGTWTMVGGSGYQYVFRANGRGTRGIAPLLESFRWREEPNGIVVFSFSFYEERWHFTVSGNSSSFYNGPLPGRFNFNRVR